jgi:hypothetical protein
MAARMNWLMVSAATMATKMARGRRKGDILLEGSADRDAATGAAEGSAKGAILSACAEQNNRRGRRSVRTA